MLEMPYQGGDLSMLAILPDKIDGLPDVEKSLSTGRLDQWTSQLRSREVEVWLPKFQITATFGLAGTLASMGMPTAFSDGADFSGMNDDGGLAINSVIHKAFIDVNEEGTEAAAATAVGISITCAWEPLPPALFCADHPFAFLIRDNVTGSILFMGRVTDPVAAARSASASVPEPATLALLAMAVVLLGPVVRLACRRGSFHKSLFINRLRRSSGGRSVTVS
jgi:serpin B